MKQTENPLGTEPEDLPNFDLPRKSEKKDEEKENPINNTNFNIKEYLDKNMISVDVGNPNINFEVLKYPVTQILYKSIFPTKKFKDEKPNFPADEISWTDAIKFCNLMSKKFDLACCYYKKENPETGKTYWEFDASSNGYRLPLKTEWEFVAHEGKNNSDFKYSGSSQINKVAWYKGNSKSELQEVGQLKPNLLGLYDFTGNVWEFCWDKYEQSSKRIVLGGCVDSELDKCNLDNSEKHFDEGEEHRFVGFRLVRSENK